MSRFRHPCYLTALACLPVLSLGIYLVAHAKQTESKQQKRAALPDQTYMPVVIDHDFESVLQADKQQKPDVMARQEKLLKQRYDLSNNPSDVMMSAGRKPVQQGVRVKLPDGVTWDALAEMPPAEIKRRDLFPLGFRPLPHAKHATGGMVSTATRTATRMRRFI